MDKKIAIVGLGGVGGYLCANFAKAGLDVVGFARGEHLKTLQNNPLIIEEDTKSWSVKCKVCELGKTDEKFDVVLFCVKSYDLKNSYKLIEKNLDKNSVIISFSNGVNNGDMLRELSKCKVIDGCIYILSHIKNAGVIQKKGKVFTAVFGKNQVLEEIFEKANLRFKIPSNIQEAIWKKFIFISAFATLTSYYNKSIGYIYQYHKDEAKEVLQTIAEVALKKGIDIKDEVQKSIKVASNVPYDSSTSMHKDFQSNKQTELQTLCGYVVKEAKKLNVDAKLMQKFYNSLLGSEK